jgi:hypothetical protein
MMDLSLIIAVILLSKGMAVTLAELGIRDKIVTACFGGLLGLFYLLLFIWDYVGRDPAASLYVYDSWYAYCSFHRHLEDCMQSHVGHSFMLGQGG